MDSRIAIFNGTCLRRKVLRPGSNGGPYVDRPEDSMSTRTPSTCCTRTVDHIRDGESRFPCNTHRVRHRRVGSPPRRTPAESGDSRHTDFPAHRGATVGIRPERGQYWPDRRTRESLELDRAALFHLRISSNCHRTVFVSAEIAAQPKRMRAVQEKVDSSAVNLFRMNQLSGL